MKWLSQNWQWIVIIGLSIWAVNNWSAARNAGKIEALRLEAQELRQEKQEIEARAEQIEADQGALQTAISVARQEIDKRQQRIEELETEREQAQRNVRQLRTEDALLDRFRETYPAVSRVKTLGITDINGIASIVIPAWFAETFIIEHQNLAACQQTVAEHQQQVERYGEIVTLHEQVLTLEREKSQAYRAGYEEAFTRYERLNTDYVAELRKPRIDLGNKFAWLGGAVLGAGACTAVRLAW